MENETSPSEKSFLGNFDWRNALITSLIAVVIGGGSGAGIVATKAVEAAGITEQQGDLRYLKLDDADRRAAKRDAQNERIEQKIDEVIKKLDEKYVRKDIYDQNNEGLRLMLRQILENQKIEKGY